MTIEAIRKSNALAMKKSIDIKPSTLKQLAAQYGVCDRTFIKWLKPFDKQLGSRVGHFYSVNQVKIIYKKLGVPGETDLDSL